MRFVFFGFCSWIGLIAPLGGAAAPVSIQGVIPPTGAEIPADFVGMSWETRTLTRSHDYTATMPGRRVFTPQDAELITLFRNLGVRHLRVGGGSVDWPVTSPIPDKAGIDDLFAFVRAAGVRKVIYSFRLLESEPSVHYAEANAEAAKYIWAHYRDQLEAFAVGNEPDRGATYRNDLAIRNVPSYLERWRAAAAAIHAAVPEATFAGPDGGSGNVSWTVGFADAEKGSGLVSEITEHLYAGGKGNGVSVAKGLEDIIGGRELEVYQGLYDRMAVHVMADGFPYRFTEANDHYSGGIPGCSNTFAGGLWVLEFLHWWAAHGAAGVDVHNTDWVINDSIHPGPDGALQAGPKCDGIRAFGLGNRGRPGKVEAANPQKLNLTAFVVGGPGHASVTILNKEHGAGAREAQVSASVSGLKPRSAKVIFLEVPGGNYLATSGATLGGDAVGARGPWKGHWTPVAVDSDGRVNLAVPATSAVVVDLQE